MTIDAGNPSASPPSSGGAPKGFDEIDILWISEGMSCDGDTVSVTAAAQPPIEDVLLGLIPELPKVKLHNKVLSPTLGGEEFLAPYRAAARGDLDPVHTRDRRIDTQSEHHRGRGLLDVVRQRPGHRRADDPQPVDRSARPASVGGRGHRNVRRVRRHSRHGRQPDGVDGSGRLPRLGLQVDGRAAHRQHPGLSRAARQLHGNVDVGALSREGLAPPPPLDSLLRPQWIFGKTVHEGCDRAAYYEQADFARDYNSPKCQVHIGCWGPVVNCNVPKRGWMAGLGGCPNVGGICIGCTMPGFPDKFMPFMDAPPGSSLSSMLIKPYGVVMRRLRAITNLMVNREPKWHHNEPELTSGFDPRYRPDGLNRSS